MDEKIRKRITMFYIAGVVNLAIGGYVLLFGRGFMNSEQYYMVTGFFLAFAALDFYFPRMIRKKWLEEQAKLEAQQQGTGGKRPLV